MRTNAQFDEVVINCREVFRDKFGQYGPSWLPLRISTLCDRIFTKAARIRRLEALGGTGKIDEGIESEFVGIANYAVLVLDRLAHEGLVWPDLQDPTPARWADQEHALTSYDSVVARAKELLVRKNHDYDEAWRQLRLSTFTDEVISRTLRLRELLAKPDDEVDAVAVEAQLVDMFNYAVLALIRIGEPNAQ